MPEPARSPGRTALVVALATVVACLGILEVGLRAMGQPPTTNTDRIFEAYGQGAYRLRRNLSERSVTRSYRCDIYTDAFGLRDRAPGPHRLDGPYVAWMGDSATFANGVDYPESFVGLFEDQAKERGLGVVNLAVGGHHISEQEDMLREFLAVAPHPPSRVVFVFTPQVLALFDVRYDDLMVKEGYLFPRDRWRLPYLKLVLGRASSAYCFFRDAIRRLQYRLLPNRWHKEEFAPPRRAGSSEKVAERLDAKLQELDDHIREVGATPVYVYLPTSPDLQKPGGRRTDAPLVEAMRRHSAASGIQLVDLTPALAAEREKGQPMAFAEDPHYLPWVHRVIARVLADRLLAGWEPALPRR